jgi:hypothetical protein
MNKSPLKYPREQQNEAPKKKFPNIPVLKDYSTPAPEEFWNKFPFKPVPRGVTKRVNESELEKMVEDSKEKLTCHQYKRAKVLLKDLSTGADAYQKG